MKTNSANFKVDAETYKNLCVAVKNHSLKCYDAGKDMSLVAFNEAVDNIRDEIYKILGGEIKHREESYNEKK